MAVWEGINLLVFGRLSWSMLDLLRLKWSFQSFKWSMNECMFLDVQLFMKKFQEEKRFSVKARNKSYGLQNEMIKKH